MTRQEIIQAISDDKMMPFIQPEQLAEIVDFVIKNYTPSLPSDLDEVAEKIAWHIAPMYPDISWDKCFEKIKDGIKSGAEWMAGQGVTKEAVIGMATGEISINVSQKTLDELDLCPGDKVVVQIRKKQ